jgi:FkbM family methyltransferase
MPASLAELLPDITIDVVDIGANPIDGVPPYAPLMASGCARVVGFEPNPEALGRLLAEKGPRETYLPYAVGDGQKHLLHLCAAQGMSSVLVPNMPLLEYFHGFPEWARVVKELEVETKRLDDIAEIDNIDLLKIDIQGYELTVFRNGVNKLSEAAVIHTEVEFLPMYRDQPLFADVDTFLREQGFLLHKFDPLVSRALRPMVINNDIFQGLGQVFWADAIYVRDFTRFAGMSGDKLGKVAMILNDVYGSWDLVYQALLARDRILGADFAERYMRMFA